MPSWQAGPDVIYITSEVCVSISGGVSMGWVSYQQASPYSLKRNENLQQSKIYLQYKGTNIFRLFALPVAGR